MHKQVPRKLKNSLDVRTVRIVVEQNVLVVKCTDENELWPAPINFVGIAGGEGPGNKYAISCLPMQAVLPENFPFFSDQLLFDKNKRYLHSLQQRDLCSVTSQ